MFFRLLGLTLLEIKSALNDTKNALSNWQEFDETPCRWTGISCHPGDDQRVSFMYANNTCTSFCFLFLPLSQLSITLCDLFFRNLPYMQLEGILSPSIGKLSGLQRL